MRMTYIPVDNYLNIDGVAIPVPSPVNLPSALHAIQMNGDSIEVEWNFETGLENDADASRLPSGFVDALIALHTKFAGKTFVYAKGLGEAATAKLYTDIPFGAPFLILNPAEIPDAPSETWDVDFSEPDGHGGQ